MRSICMIISYKKLWKLLIDKDMKKQDLREAAQLSSSTVAKLTHGDNVSTAVLLKICTAILWKLCQTEVPHQRNSYRKGCKTPICLILEMQTRDSEKR